MTSTSWHREPTDGELWEWVTALVADIHDGWTPPLEMRLRFGLTAEVLQALRSMPAERDILAEPNHAPTAPR